MAFNGRRTAVARAVLLVVTAGAMLLPSALSLHGHGGRFNKGDPDGAGGIPYAGPPLSPLFLKMPHAITVGLVVEPGGAPIGRVPIVVLAKSGAVVGAGMTDDDGVFEINLPVTTGLTATLPLNGVANVPIHAGVPLVIVVP